MFITESSYLKMSADPAEMLSVLVEANEAYHDLCMKMVKCEHTAIVNENNALLAEAEVDFKTKLKKILDTIIAKFMAFIDRVRAEWSKLWSSILTKLVNKEKVAALKQLIKEETIEVKVDLFAIERANDIFKYAISVSPIETAVTTFAEKMKEYKEVEAEKVTKVDAGMIDDAVKFLTERPNMIKALETFKSTAKKLYTLAMQVADLKVDQLVLAKFSSAVSKVIVKVNSATKHAVRICRAGAKAEKKADGYKDAVKDYKKDKKQNAKDRKARRDAALYGESVLDLFD